MLISIVKYITIILITCLLGQYTYWWFFCIFTFVMGIMCKTSKEAIMINSLGAGSAWAIDTCDASSIMIMSKSSFSSGIYSA